MSKDSNVRKSDNANTNRRKRRAERNRIRAIKHAHKLLDQIVEGVGTGFNHHGWCNAASSLKTVSAMLEPEEYQAIGRAWSTLYADSGSNVPLVSAVARIKERIAGNLLEKL